MTDKTKELLAVLDLPEDEQLNWCIDNVEGFYGDGAATYYKGEYCLSLADLAFRLRPKPSKEYHAALRIVYDYLWEHGTVHCDYVNWLEFHIRPRDRIIAALIAKEMAKETKVKEDPKCDTDS